MEISGNVFFVTGAAEGLGKVCTEALLERGAQVFFGDINSELGNTTYHELKQKYSDQNVKFSVFDVTQHASFREAFALAVSTFGHVDVMVNNAGIMDESRWIETIQINYMSVVLGTQMALEHMRKDNGGRGGRVLNVASKAGLGYYSFVPVYCSSKHAVHAFTSCMAAVKCGQRFSGTAAGTKV